MHDDENINPRAVELFPGASANHGGFIDFHFNNSTNDYTSRIIESAIGVLTLYGSLKSNGAFTAPAFYSEGRLGIPLRLRKSDKTATDKDWYQDIQFDTSDNIRVSVIRSAIDASGNRHITIGVSSSSNVAPSGIMIKRVETDSNNYVYASTQSNVAYSTSQIRNISADTTSRTAGVSTLANGYIYVQYE